jgi:alkylated DNA repair dioxygenase AlkB
VRSIREDEEMRSVDDPELVWQQCLFAFAEPAFDADFCGLTRTWLDEETWIDHAPRWLQGADLVFAQLVELLPWQQREVIMWERRLDEPRLTAWWNTHSDDPEALPILAQARAAFTRYYGKPFDSIGFNLYRDGHDSVAWHGDRERFAQEDPTVVIVSTGQPRSFHLRPRGGGQSLSWQLGHGDLFVMGGSCQHDWEHCVPKVAHAGPRLSIMFRHNLIDTEVRD